MSSQGAALRSLKVTFEISHSFNSETSSEAQNPNRDQLNVESRRWTSEELGGWGESRIEKKFFSIFLK